MKSVAPPPSIHPVFMYQSDTPVGSVLSDTQKHISLATAPVEHSHSSVYR